MHARPTSPAPAASVPGASAGSPASRSIRPRTSGPRAREGRSPRTTRSWPTWSASYAITASAAPNHHERIGSNARLGELTAAALRIKLPHLEDWTQARRRVATRYAAGLADANPIRLPHAEPWADPVWHLYPVEVADRDAVRAGLHELGIATGVHYPTPIHLQPAYAHLGHGAGSFPEAERNAARVLSLPMFPELTDAQVDRVVEALLTTTDEGR